MKKLRLPGFGFVLKGLFLLIACCILTLPFPVLGSAATYTIEGFAYDSFMAGLPGVDITATGGISTTTNGIGYYILTVSDTWTGTVTPTLAGYTFTPPFIDFPTPLTGNLVDQSFTAAPVTHVISGYVQDPGGTGVTGVTLTGTPGGYTDVTDATGYYELAVPHGWTGSVIPAKTDWTFVPSFLGFTNVTADISDADFVGTGPPQVVSTQPGDGAIGQSVDTDVRAYFDQEMNPATINTTTFELRELPSLTDIAGTVTYFTGEKKAMFVPESPLAYFANYRAIVNTGMQAATGTPLPAAVQWEFSTGGPASNASITLSGSTEAADYRMVACMVQPPDGSPAQVLGISDYDTAQMRIGRWDAALAQYVEFPFTGATLNQVGPAWAGWFLFRNGHTLNFNGTEPGLTANPAGFGEPGFMFPLIQAGWNQVGNPFNFKIYASDLRLVLAGIPQPVDFYVWSGGAYYIATGVLPIGQGGWVHSPADGSLFFEKPAVPIPDPDPGDPGLVDPGPDAMEPPSPPAGLGSSGQSSSSAGSGGGGGCFIDIPL